MKHLLLKYLSIYLSASIKFLGGLIVGCVEDLNFLEIAIFSFLGSMSTIVCLSFIGNRYRSKLALIIRKIKIGCFHVKLWIATKLGNIEKEESLAYLKLQALKSKPKKFTRISRLAVKTWRRFGLWGIASIAPMLSPTLASLICVSYRVRTRKIVMYMAVTHAVSAIVLAFLFVEFKDIIQDWTGINLRANH